MAASFGPQESATTEADHPLSVFPIDRDGDRASNILSTFGYNDRTAWHEDLSISAQLSNYIHAGETITLDSSDLDDSTFFEVTEGTQYEFIFDGDQDFVPRISFFEHVPPFNEPSSPLGVYPILLSDDRFHYHILQSSKFPVEEINDDDLLYSIESDRVALKFTPTASGDMSFLVSFLAEKPYDGFFTVTMTNTSDTDNGQSWLLPIGGTPFEDWVIVNYVDQDPGSEISDYNGGVYSYDGHQGIDFTLPHFQAMDNLVPVFAAKDGTVTRVEDGFFDRSRWDDLRSPDEANLVYIEHEQGHETRYLHLMKDSITVTEGDEVRAGDRIGYVGSSGFSTDPHLHFEIRKYDQVLEPAERLAVDLPYAGDVEGVLASGIFLSETAPTFSELQVPPPSVTTFSAEEPTVWAWVNAHGVDPGEVHGFRWHPPGESSTEYAWTQADTTQFGWFYSDFSLSRVADSRGDWQVDFFINGEVKDTQYLTIADDSGSPNNPPNLFASFSFTIAENSVCGEFVGDLDATDGDGGAPDVGVTYAIANPDAIDPNGNDTPAFRIDEDSGEITVNDPDDLDFETTPTFTFDVTASDGVRQAFTEAVVNLEDLSDSAPGSLTKWIDWTDFTVGNSLEGSATGNLAGSSITYYGEVDSGTVVDGTGQIWNPASSFIGGSSDTSPDITGDYIKLNGNGGSNNKIVFDSTVTNPLFAIWSLGSPQLNASFSFSHPAIFQAGGPNSSFFGSAIEVSDNLVTGFEGNGVVQFMGEFDSISWTNTFEHYFAFTIGVNEVDADNPPEVLASYSFSIAENSVWGQFVGDVDATDGDGGAPDVGVTYAIADPDAIDPNGNDTPAFRIDEDSGEITVNDPDDLDFETTPTFSLDVTASDGVHPASTAVVVNLEDVPEREEYPALLTDIANLNLSLTETYSENYKNFWSFVYPTDYVWNTLTGSDLDVSEGEFLDSGLYINETGVAGAAQYEDTLVVAFKGSDPIHEQPEEWLRNISGMETNYEIIRPFVNAIDNYIEINSIDRVIVTGMSLGGALSELFMEEHTGDQYEAITFGSPGTPSGFFGHFDSRITNFEHTDDWVTALSESTILSNLLLIIPQYLILEILAGTVFEEDGLDNTGIPFSIDFDYNASNPIIGEHDMQQYANNLSRLENLTVLEIIEELGGESLSILFGDNFSSGSPPTEVSDTLVSPDDNANIMIGGGHDDEIFGGSSEYDYAIFSSPLPEYQIEKLFGSGGASIQHIDGSKSDGNDFVNYEVEWLVFEDTIIRNEPPEPPVDPIYLRSAYEVLIGPALNFQISTFRASRNDTLRDATNETIVSKGAELGLGLTTLSSWQSFGREVGSELLFNYIENELQDNLVDLDLWWAGALFEIAERSVGIGADALTGNWAGLIAEAVNVVSDAISAIEDVLATRQWLRDAVTNQFIETYVEFAEVGEIFERTEADFEEWYEKIDGNFLVSDAEGAMSQYESYLSALNDFAAEMAESTPVSSVESWLQDLEDLKANPPTDQPTQGDDVLQGSEGDDQVDGDSGNDIMQGKAGNDELFGGDGNDWVLGDEGDDVLAGDFGNDTLEGGEGTDILTGGAGGDEFAGLASEHNGDTITDFSDEDRLFVRGSDFGRDDVTVEDGSAILNIDSNRDGETDTVLTLEGDFSGMDFEVASDEAGTTIQVVPVDEGGATFPAEPNLFDVLLPSSGRLVLPSGSHAKLIDAPGSQTVDVARGAGFTLSGASGENVFRFEQDSNAFTVARVDNRLQLTAEDGAVSHLPPDADPQTLVFADGSAALTIDGAQLMLGNMVVGAAASPIIATLDPLETSEGIFAGGLMLHLADNRDDLL